jgi:hypothetical protein
MNTKKWIKVEYKDQGKNKVRFFKVKDIDSVNIQDTTVTFTKDSGFTAKNNVTNIQYIFEKVVASNLI